MSNNLKSSDFGLKIYNRFPPKYREDDEEQKLALKRYLQALSDGGFKHCIDDINRLTTLIDPESMDINQINLLFEQYGLEIFNGIPEIYLRYLLPNLSEAWSKKGSLSVLEFVTSTVSGIKSNPVVRFTKEDEEGNTYYDYANPTIDIKLEMDYNIGNYFPKADQLLRIITNFVPFYCDMVLVYSYLFYEEQVVRMNDSAREVMSLTYSVKEEASLLGEDVNDEHNNLKIGAVEESTSLWNLDHNALTNSFTTLNNGFCTNGLTSYDIVTKSNGKIEVLY